MPVSLDLHRALGQIDRRVEEARWKQRRLGGGGSKDRENAGQQQTAQRHWARRRHLVAAGAHPPHAFPSSL